MNQCSFYNNRFSEYIDQKLTDEARGEFSRHLSGCADCAADFAGFEKAHAALQLLSRPLPSRPALAAVRARIRQEEEARSKKKLWVWLPAPALAVAVVAAVAFGLNGSRDVQVATTGLGNSAIVTGAPSDVSRGSDVGTDTKEVGWRGVSAAVRKASIEPAGHSDVVRRVRRVTRAGLRMAAQGVGLTTELVRQIEPAIRVKKRPAYVMVAYYPPADYSVKFENQSTGQKGEIAVKTTLAEDGSVERASLKYHLSPATDAVEDNDSQDIPNEERSDSRGSLPSYILPV